MRQSSNKDDVMEMDNVFRIQAGESSVGVSRSGNAGHALAELLRSRHIRLVTIDRTFSDRVGETFGTYVELKSAYKLTKWHYMPVSMTRKGVLKPSSVSDPQDCSMWLLVDKHGIRLNEVGMRQATLADVVKRCQEDASEYIGRYNAIVAGDIFDLDIEYKGNELLYRDVVAPTPQALVQYVVGRTTFIEREFDEVIHAIGALDYRSVPYAAKGAAAT